MLFEVDLLTASSRVVRTQLVQDTGMSLNPHLDVGHVEGGFMYGLGYSCLEEMIFAPDGHLITNNVTGYKVRPPPPSPFSCSPQYLSVCV